MLPSCLGTLYANSGVYTTDVPSGTSLTSVSAIAWAFDGATTCTWGSKYLAITSACQSCSSGLVTLPEGLKCGSPKSVLDSVYTFTTATTIIDSYSVVGIASFPIVSYSIFMPTVHYG